MFTLLWGLSPCGRQVRCKSSPPRRHGWPQLRFHSSGPWSQRASVIDSCVAQCNQSSLSKTRCFYYMDSQMNGEVHLILCDKWFLVDFFHFYNINILIWAPPLTDLSMNLFWEIGFRFVQCCRDSHPLKDVDYSTCQSQHLIFLYNIHTLPWNWNY